MATKAAKKRKPTKDKDQRELAVQLAALKGIQHNPVDWTAVVRLVAPVLARLAARYAASYLASKWNKRATPKIRKEVAEDAADKLSASLTKK